MAPSLQVLALCCINRDKVSADAHTPMRFSILIKSVDHPWLSMTSVINVCIGIEQRSSVINIIVHSRKSLRRFLMWCADDVSSSTAELPLLSRFDFVNRHIASHSFGFIFLH